MERYFQVTGQSDLYNQYRISDFLEDWDIGMNDFVSEIEDVLSDIL